MNRIAAFLIKGCLAAVMAIMALWAYGAVYYSNLPQAWMRTAGAVLFIIAAILLFWKIRGFYRAVFSFAALWGVVLVWWLLIPASNTRQWQPDLAVLPYAEINGNQVTIRNIRNCEYRSTTDYTTAYYDRTFDMDKLRCADLFIVYWGSPLIAHTIMSFDFDDGQHVCISIETRKEVGEDYSAIKGFFKQFELMYVVADERDLIRLRTNFRGEEVYLYRLNTKPQMVREVFLDYFKTINLIAQKPQWYNALTQNCTTAIRGHTHPYVHGRFNWRMIVNGKLDTLLYERGAIATDLPFEEFKQKSKINDIAKAVPPTGDFSAAIRQVFQTTAPTPAP